MVKQMRIFEKNGLDMELIYFTAGTTAAMALVSGDTRISQVAGAGVVKGVLAGSDLVHGSQRNYLSHWDTT